MVRDSLEVSFTNEIAGLRLAGSLTLPASADKHPGAVLIHGQGPFDRDQRMLGMCPLKTIAEYLADQGIATLRYDKRGIGKSEGDFPSSTIVDFASDAEAAIDWLVKQTGIDPERTGILGISEGGIIAPAVASRSDRVAFCVMLAGPVLPGTETVALSFAIMMNNSHSRDQSFITYHQNLNKLSGIIKGGMSGKRAKSEALKLATDLAPRFINDNTRFLLGGIDRISPEELIRLLSAPCFATTTIYEPRKYLPPIACPVLALYGSKDVHVPAREHIEEIDRIRKAGTHKDFTVMEIPDVNHLFQRCTTGFPTEYLTIDHDISPHVLDIITDWVGHRTLSSKN